MSPVTSKEQRTRGESYEAPTPVPKAKRTRGRPSEFEPGLIAEACMHARYGATDQEIAEELGIATGTLYRWYQAYPQLREAVKAAKEHVDDRVERSLYRRALEGSDTASIFWLKNRRSQEWRDRHETEIIVPDTGDAPALDHRDLALAGLALFNSAVYDPTQPAGPVIEGHAREEIGHGQLDGYSERAEGQRRASFEGPEDREGSGGGGAPDPDFDGHPFDLDPGEV